MAHMLVLFNLHYDDTYSERYRALNKAIEEAATGEVWDETTSSCAFQSNSSAVTLDVRFSTAARVDPKKDALVVIDLDKREKSSTGVKNNLLLTKNLGF